MCKDISSGFGDSGYKGDIGLLYTLNPKIHAQKAQYLLYELFYNVLDEKLRGWRLGQDEEFEVTGLFVDSLGLP